MTDDQKRIVVALSLLKGAAHKYMSSYYDKLEAGQSVGTWANFKNELVQIYGQRDDKEGAKKELTALFNNKDLATKNFVKYAEKFRTLGRLSGYDDALLIEKLRLVIDNSMRMCLIGAINNLPNRWTDFLDLLLDYYKELYPEKTQGKIFAKMESNNVPMCHSFSTSLHTFYNTCLKRQYTMVTSASHNPWAPNCTHMALLMRSSRDLLMR